MHCLGNQLSRFFALAPQAESVPTSRIGPHIRTHSVSQSLDMDLVSLIHRALAGSTTSTYKVGIQRYPAFCKALDLAPDVVSG